MDVSVPRGSIPASTGSRDVASTAQLLDFLAKDVPSRARRPVPVIDKLQAADASAAAAAAAKIEMRRGCTLDCPGQMLHVAHWHNV